MPGFLSPLLLLLLSFTYSLAAPNHFAKHLIGMQWEGSLPPSCPPDQLGLCICPQLWRGPQVVTSSVSRMFDRLDSCRISTCAHRADGPKFTSRDSPGLVWCSDACITLNVRAWFTGPNLIVLQFCTVSTKNTSWCPANLLTLFQS